MEDSKLSLSTIEKIFESGNEQAIDQIIMNQIDDLGKEKKTN